jgi:hypothetical protein
MATAQRALGRPGKSRSPAADQRAWLRPGLAAAFAAVALAGLIDARNDPRGADGPRQAIVATDDRAHRWASPGPSWRSRSQVLAEAGILRRP